MRFGNQEHFLLSLPHEVHWAGWESTTTRLQQMGWQLSAQQAIDDLTIRLALKHPTEKIYGVSDKVRVKYFERNDREQLNFNIVHMVSEFWDMGNVGLSSFEPIDAMPQMVQQERKSIRDFAIFAPSLARTEEIIVEPSSVQECLDIIKKLQAPQLDEIRERNRLRDRRGQSFEPIQRQVFHAQILSFAA